MNTTMSHMEYSMKYFLSLISLTILVGCGGGGGAAGVLTPVVAPSGITYYTGFTTTTLDDVTNQFVVIDGYIEGANVFLDWNYNGIQDTGETSASWMGVDPVVTICTSYDSQGCIETGTYDPPDNYYYFLTRESEEYAPSDFNGQFLDDNITDYSSYCKSLRPVMSVVPEGAYDSDRGYVDTAYEMMAMPSVLERDITNGTNITPFTTLINPLFSSLMVTDYPIDESCSTGAISQGENIVQSIEQYINTFLEMYNISLDFFYEDFFKSEDVAKQQLAMDIVDIISTVTTAKDILEDTVNLPYRYVFSEGVMSDVMSGNFTTLDFDINHKIEESQVFNDLVTYSESLYSDITTDKDGNLYSYEGDIIPMSFGNISVSASSVETSTVHQATNIMGMDDVHLYSTVASGYDNGILSDISFTRVQFSKPNYYRSMQTNQRGKLFWVTHDYRFSIAFGPGNPMANFNTNSVVNNGDLNTAQDILNSINSVSHYIEDAQNTISYLYAGDELQYAKTIDGIEYTYSYTVGGDEFCLTYDTSTQSESFNRTNPYVQCSELIQ